MRSTKRVALKRLAWEFEEIIKNPIEGVCAGPVSEDNLFQWEAIVRGPTESP
jgi:ubiquitin-conjugating enzyme E2 G2